jgi:hypothetical protein
MHSIFPVSPVELSVKFPSWRMLLRTCGIWATVNELIVCRNVCAVLIGVPTYYSAIFTWD